VAGGAGVIEGGGIGAGGCLLPVSGNRGLSRTLGTRHRAAVGLSEETDAAVVVVSEETGVISLAVDGVIERGLDTDRLQERLTALLNAGEAPSRGRSLLAGGRWAPGSKA